MGFKHQEAKGKRPTPSVPVAPSKQKTPHKK